MNKTYKYQIFAITSPLLDSYLNQLAQKEDPPLRHYADFDQAYLDFSKTQFIDYEMAIFLLNGNSTTLISDILTLRSVTEPIAILVYIDQKRPINELIYWIKAGANDVIEISQENTQIAELLAEKFEMSHKKITMGPWFKQQYSSEAVDQGGIIKEPLNWRLDLLNTIHKQIATLSGQEPPQEIEEADPPKLQEQLDALLVSLSQKTNSIPPERKKPGVLVVDDEEMIRNQLKLMLADDYIIYEAVDGSELIGYMLHKPEALDAILLDIMMPADRLGDAFPDGKGTTLLFVCKLTLPAVSIMMLTAYDDLEFINECFRRGASDYILKDDSFTESVLKEKINNAVDKKYYETVLTDLVKKLR